MRLQEVDSSDWTEEEKNTHLMLLIWCWCDAEDKSTEFMFAYMSDELDMDYDDVVDKFVQLTDEQKSEFYATFPTWYGDLQEMS